MRVAVSDYDGTLCLNRAVSPADIAGITAWREAGNVFGIATGRDVSTAQYEIERWNVPFDFLLCCNGGTIYDANLRVLQTTNIDASLIRAVLDHNAAEESMHCSLCRDGVIHVHVRSNESWFLKLACPYTVADIEALRELPSAQQICFGYQDAGDTKKHAEAIERDFGDYLRTHYNKGYLDITAESVSKASAVLDVLALNNWPRQGLLAVGDGGNDLPMLREFAGYAVHGATLEVLQEAHAVYAGVGEMLLAHL